MSSFFAVATSEGATDWWARGAGIAGVTIALVGVLLTARRDRQMRQQTTAELVVNNYSFVPGVSAKPSEFLTITIRNRGRPVTVENVGIDFLPHRDDGVGLTMVSLDGGTIPALEHVVLGDGEAKSLRYHVRCHTDLPGEKVGQRAMVCGLITVSTQQEPIQTNGVTVDLWTEPPKLLW